MLENLSKKFTDIFKQVSGKAHISPKNIRDALGEIKIALLEADVNLRVVRRFINRATEEALGEKVKQYKKTYVQITNTIYKICIFHFLT